MKYIVSAKGNLFFLMLPDSHNSNLLVKLSILSIVWRGKYKGMQSDVLSQLYNALTSQGMIEIKAPYPDVGVGFTNLEREIADGIMWS